MTLLFGFIVFLSISPTGLFPSESALNFLKNQDGIYSSATTIVNNTDTIPAAKNNSISEEGVKNHTTLNDSDSSNSQNLIYDGSFESGRLVGDAKYPIAYWGSTGKRFGGNVSITNEDKHSGQYSLKVESIFEHAAYAYQYFEPNETANYTLSFWYKGGSSNGVVEVLTDWGPPPWFLGGFNDGKFGAEVGLDSSPNSKFPLDGKWHHAVVISTPSTQALYLDDNLVGCKDGNAIHPTVMLIGDLSTETMNSSFYVDDISLVNGLQRNMIGKCDDSRNGTDMDGNKKGLVGEWTFEGTVKDTSNINKGITVNDGAVFVEGLIGKTLLFDGKTGVVSVPDIPDLNFGGNSSFSISLWLKSNQSGGGSTGFGWLVDHRRNNDGTYAGYTIGDHSGTIIAVIRDSFGNNAAAYSSTDVNDDRWHHVVLVVDRSDQKEFLYIDNKVEDIKKITSIGNIGTAFDLHFGGTTYPNTPVDFYSGALDQVRIYDRALTELEVQSLYDEPSQ